MNNVEETPDHLIGHGDMLPAEVLKKVNELLKKLSRQGHYKQGGTVITYYAEGSQHIDQQVNIGTCAKPPKAKPKGGKLPEVLATPEAMAYWQKVQQAGLVDENYQPLISRPQAALLANMMAEWLGIREKWKVFEAFWHRKNMRSDYNEALDQRQTLVFREKLKKLKG